MRGEREGRGKGVKRGERRMPATEALLQRLAQCPPDAACRAEVREWLLARFPALTLLTPAESLLGRPIELYRLGQGRRPLLLIGAHHATEYLTASLLYLLIAELCERSEREKHGGVTDYRDNFCLHSFTFYLLPSLNPDGIELHLHGAAASPLCQRQLQMSGGDFTHWQANGRGVDLNHNYDAGCEAYRRIMRERGIVAGASLYAGEHPESEPESRLAASLLRVLAPALTLTLHSQGEVIYPAPAEALSLRVAYRLGRQLGYEVQMPEGTACYGGLSDYAARLRLPSLTLELGRGENPLPPSALPPLADRVLLPLLRVGCLL